jgi:hypothetical protein
MSENQIIWAKASEEAVSYRRMYALALEIEGSATASDELRSAARKVVRILADVIDLPIADARILGKARKKFRRLAERLDLPHLRSQQAFSFPY